MTLMGDEPKTLEGLGTLLDTWGNEADLVMTASDVFKGLDLNDESDAREAVERVKSRQNTLEFAAVMTALFAGEARRRLNDDNSNESAVWVARASLWWATLVFYRDLENHVWTGYRHNAAIYEIAQASASTVAEAESIAALRPIFEKLSEDVLHVWVESDADIGPRIGVSSVDEKLLKALAKFHLTQFEKKRSDKQLGHENRMRRSTVIIAASSGGAAVATAVGGILKLLGVL
jgi:hypothetical protein